MDLLKALECDRTDMTEGKTVDVGDSLGNALVDRNLAEVVPMKGEAKKPEITAPAKE